MISYREALQNLLSKVTPIGRTETIPTLYAEGRVLAEDIISPVNVPPADNSQMDGYAVRAADLASASPEHPVTLPVSQRIPAGSVGTQLETGTAARIFTGAQVPPGADSVVQQELVEKNEDGTVVFKAPVKTGTNVRLAGSDFPAGETILHAGDKLTPANLGIAASTGRAYLRVYGRLRVSIFCSGSELASRSAKARFITRTVISCGRFSMRSAAK